MIKFKTHVHSLDLDIDTTINKRSQEAVMGWAQPVVVTRARAPRDAAVQHFLEYFGSEHPELSEVRGERWVGRTVRECTSGSHAMPSHAMAQ